MDIAMSKTREQFPLSSKKPLKKTIASMIVWFIVLIIVYVCLIVFLTGSSFIASFSGANGEFNPLMPVALATLVTLLIFFIIFSITYIYQRWYYEVYFYDLTDNFIIIRKGVITPREITIPYERVQDVYMDQDILDRIFRLYDVHLSSATISSGMEAHIDGLERPAAEGLKGQLLKTVGEKISKKSNLIEKPIDSQIPNG